MSQAAKVLLPLVLLGGLAGGAWYLLSNDPVAPPVAPVHQPEQPQHPTPEPLPVQAPTTTPVTVQDPQRTKVEVPSEAHSDAQQGVRGRLSLPNGAPAADVPVYLMESTSSDPLKVYLTVKTGQRIPPVASSRTAQDGSFMLGITTVGAAYDLRVVPDQFPEIQRTGLRVPEFDWYDAGNLQLQQGVVVQGRVTIEGQGTPIAGAKVYLTTPTQNFQALPTPGRERGTTVDTDSAGFYRFTTAPREGLITLIAEAPEYAATEKANVQVKPDELNEFNLELAHGMPIYGLVVDVNGKPVAGAQVNATALSAKVPVSVNTKTGADGAFQTQTLREGPYKLTATANGFEEKTGQAMAGENDVKLVLDPRGQVKLRVLSAKGVPIRAYSLSLRKYFPNNPGAIGKVMEFKDNQRITPANYEGEWALIPNVPAGEFVFQVTDNDHAKTLSPSFTVAPGQPVPEVVCTLTMGAGITGIVVDDSGRPVANATVATDMNGGFAADTGFLEMFKPFLPDKHTTTSVKTDGGGRFVVKRLAFADYMLRITHPDFCEGASLDIKLDTDGQLKDVGTVALSRGAVIEGICQLGGQPIGQVKVQVGPPEGSKPEVDAQGRPKMFFSAYAITDNDGRFRLLKRVPPGAYKIHASRQGGNNDIFGPLMDMKATARQMQIGAGQEQSVQNFELPAR